MNEFCFCVTHLQITDPAEIEKMVIKVISENPKQLEQYRSGKTKLQGYFAGQVWQIRICILLKALPRELVQTHICFVSGYENVERQGKSRFIEQDPPGEAQCSRLIEASALTELSTFSGLRTKKKADEISKV